MNLTRGQAPIITLEEHYWDPELDTFMVGPAASRSPYVWDRLLDFESTRLREMDAADITMQVLSLTAPSLQNVPAKGAGDIARRANDRLAGLIVRHPDRFDGFAALPTTDPDAAVVELERAVTKLRFKGALICGLTQGQFLDDSRFHPLLECAARLDVPIYIHPSWPHADLTRTYLGEYAEKFPLTAYGVWGFTVETATHAVRLMLSDVFDKYPGLKIILGHLGEGLPFLLWRINNTYIKEKPAGPSLRDRFTTNFYVTTSGFFSAPALKCTLDEIGYERVLFSVDYPYAQISQARTWIDGVALDDRSRRAILGGNAVQLLRLNLT